MVDLNHNQPAPTTNVRELLQSLWQGKFIIAGVALLVTALAIAQYYTAIPNYNAKALIMVKLPDKAKLIKDTGTGGQEFDLPTDVELLKSYPLANTAVLKLLNSPERDHLQLLGTRSLRSKGKAASTSHGPDTTKVRRFADDLQHRITADNIRGTNLIEVSVSSPFPDEAALLANTVCDAFSDKNAEWSGAQDLSVSRIIEKQIVEQEQKVRATELALSNFMRGNEIYEASGNVSELQRAFSSASSEYDANRVQYEILKNQLAFIDQKLSTEERSFSRSLNQNIGNQLRSMQDNVRAKENAYISLALQKGGNDPEVQAARSQLVNLKAQYDQVNRKKLAGEIANSGNAQKYRYDMLASKMQVSIRLAELENSAREYQRLKNNYQGQLNELPVKQVNFAKLTLDNEVAKKTYAFLKEKLDEARIKAASNVGGVVMINPAYPPSRPKSPNLIQNLLVGIGGGLLLGVLAVIMKEKLA